MEVPVAGHLSVTMLPGVRSASSFEIFSGVKRKEGEIYPLRKDDSIEKRPRIGPPVVCSRAISPSPGSTHTPVQLKAGSHELSRSSHLPHVTFGDPDLLKRQLQQMASMQQRSEGSAGVPASAAPAPSGASPEGIRLPKGSVLSLDPPVSTSNRASPPPQQEPVTVKSEGATQGGTSSQRSSGFLVQQPSSKLWMEAVPMRTGTKASTSYRVYSNAFMEGRRQNGVSQGSGYAQPGIPSITSCSQRGRPVPPARPRPVPGASESSQQLVSRQRSFETSLGGPVIVSRAMVQQQQQTGTPLDVVRLAHAAADRVLQRRMAEQPKAAADAPAEVEGRLGSEGSCDTLVPIGQPLSSLRRSLGSLGQPAQTGATAAGASRSISGPRDPDAAAVAASQLEQERQLAALMMIQDAAAAGAASLLSSAGAQGSSNLIYILKSLQEQSRSSPQALLAQLQAVQDCPRQQLALMRMLRESLPLPAQVAPRAPSPDQPPQGSSRPDSPGKMAHKWQSGTKPPVTENIRLPTSHYDARRTAKPAAAPVEAPPRISHEEALQGLEAHSELRVSARPGAGAAERMARIGSDPGAAERQPSGGRVRALSEGSPHAHPTNTPHVDSPNRSEALSGPSLIFNDSATSEDRLKRLNPFNGPPSEHYAADSGRRAGWRGKGGVPSHPIRRASGRAPRPISPPVTAPKEELPSSVPAKDGLEKEAAEILLFLNGTERGIPDRGTPPPEEDPPAVMHPPADAAAPADAAQVSPLQALVQDIMQQQKQLAQVNAMASLPRNVARSEMRYGVPSRPEAVDTPAPQPPPRRKPGRPPKKRLEEAPAVLSAAPPPPPPMLHRQPSAGRFSVLGFAVPSARRTGGKAVRQGAQEMHFGYNSGKTISRHRSSGSSGNASERGARGARSGAYPLTRPRRVHRPADYDSGAEFSGGSSDARSVDSGSWNSKEVSRKVRRKA